MIEGRLVRTERGGFQVFVDNEELDVEPSLKIYSHSPDGFAWGYMGSGPSQLALALLLHFTDDNFALKNYMDFKTEVIAQIDQYSNWTLENDVAEQWAADKGFES